MNTVGLKANFVGTKVSAKAAKTAAPVAKMVTKCGPYDAELIETANKIATAGRGILAMDESNGTCGKRLEAVGVENVEANRRAYRDLLVSTPGLGDYISGAILFEETLYQSKLDGTSFVDTLNASGVVPGIKVDKGLVPMTNSNNESWCQGLDGLADRCAAYYKQGARFCKWRSVVSVEAGPSEKALFDCAYGLARYAAIAQENGLVPIVEPEVLLDGTHTIEETYEVALKIWAQTFKCMADQGVMFEGILLKPAMVTPGADCPDRASPEKVAELTLKMLGNRVPPSVPGIMFLSGGQSELEATLNLNAMNQTPNPWHVSFSFARALQNSVIKCWAGDESKTEEAQKILLARCKANSDANLGKFEADGSVTDERTYEKGYVY
eukprot:CAMPEP_0197849738 /NCGR_PEP_ID=MMETSP1438-20131217/13078_1 /TAXON_ID=1461541 /ORGANISM="Pterosperma sp., Strain CCMP1384" /LENGTH=381 /DNA_ID=CAMNT_0043462559 /DNA_START=67 /DNA_END=1212 /DNA_ORIENTATION=-